MDRMTSIAMALKNEEIEMNFYRNEAKRSQNQLAKAMFEKLAKEEGEHMKRIRKLHDRLVEQKSWPVDVPIEVNGTNIREILQKTAKQSGSEKNHNLDDKKAIEKAIAFEAKGEVFYHELAAKCDNPMEKNFFTFMAGIEREHHLSLVDSLVFLTDPRAWLEQHEHQGLDGA
jgi:rubrerythrin